MLLAMVALLTFYLAAWKAAKIDPLATLRSE